MKKIVKGVSIVSFALLLFACSKKQENSTTKKNDTTTKNIVTTTAKVVKTNPTTTTKITTNESKCIVSFDSKGGSNVDSQKIKKGEKIERPLDPKMEGYTFSDWYYNDEKWSFDNVINSNITLEAKWTINSYTLTLNTNSELGSVTGANTYEYNSDVTIKATPKDGYVFAGWYKNGIITDYLQEDTFKMPSSDLTLEAKFVDNLENFILDPEDPYKVVGVKDSNVFDLIIPDNVTGLGVLAFKNCINLTSVTIGEGIKDLYAGVFQGCTGLTTVKISSSVTFIERCIFEGCNNLSTIKVDPNNPVYDSRNDCNAIIKKENNELIAGCKTTVIPNSVTSLGEGAFQKIESITFITIPDRITSIGDSAFNGCSNLENIEIPNGVTRIGNSAFRDCYSITSITIPNSVTSIGGGAFNGCGLTSIIIPDSVTSIGASAFYDCDSLQNVTIGNNVTSIGGEAFAYCDNLTSITLPNGITSIEDGLFQYSGLISIIIPNSVTSIGLCVFYECYCLEKIFYEGSSSDWSNVSIGSANYSLDSATIYYYVDLYNDEDLPDPSDGNYWYYNDDKEPIIWES